MDVKTSPAEKCKRYIEVTMPPEEFEPRMTESLKSYQKRIEIRGFRKGKAPLQLVKQMYGSAIREKTIEDLVPQIISDTTAQNGWKTVGPAHLEDLKYDEKIGLSFRAYVEVEPEIELRKYKGLEFERLIYEVEDQDVADTLEEIREQRAVMKVIDDEAQPGHYVVADFQKIDAAGLPIIGEKYEDRRLQLSTDDEFTRPLIGAKRGEPRRVSLTERRPDGTPAETPTFYQATIKEIAEKILPPLDDTFVTGFNNITTLEELKQAIREQLHQRAEQRSRENLHHAIIDELLKTNPFELPEGLTASYVESFTKSLQSRFRNASPETLQEEARKAAVWRLRWNFLRERIAQAERLDVTDEELRDALISHALAANEDPQRLINQTMHNEEKREKWREDLLEAKILQFLEGHMHIRERRVPFTDRESSRIFTV